MNDFQNKRKYEAVVVGVSTGGMKALEIFLPELPSNFPLAVIVVQHLRADQDDFLMAYLNNLCEITVKEANDNEKIKPSCVYIAPADYHLFVEESGVFSLSMDEKVNYSRPSIDVLFESASRVYEERLIGIVLTGANGDGSAGLKKIKTRGGHVIVQDPKSAKSSQMPQAAIAVTKVDQILPLQEIGPYLRELGEGRVA